MLKKTTRAIGIFVLVFLPVLALSFLAYTVFHQIILFLGALVAAWAAFYVGNLKTEQDRLSREVFLQAYELKKAEETLESCLATEAKTKAYSQRLLDSKLTEESNRAKRYHRPLSCLLVAIDSFAEVSQTHGSVFSEVVVQELARFLKESVRSVDSLIRHGDDRWVLILPETQLNQAGVVANRIRFAVEKNAFHINGEAAKMTVSAGLMRFDPDVHRGKEDIMAVLEQALLVAKKAGQNQVAAGVSKTA